MITINGKQKNSFMGKSISDYLIENNYNIDFVAIEYNERILPKANYASTILNDGDNVEIVSFVGGG